MLADSLRPLDRVPAGAAGLSIVVGLSGLAAWVLGEHGPGLLAPLLRMQFNSAVALLIAGIGVLALHQRWRPTSLVCGGWLLAIGGLTLLEYAHDVDLGIDQVLFVSRLVTDNPHPGRMGATAAACFALIGMAMLALGRRQPSRLAVIVSGACAGTLVICGIWVLCIYVTSIATSTDLSRFAQMAIPTALSLSGLGIGIACVAIRAREDWLQSRLDVKVPALAWGVLVTSLVLSMAGWYLTALSVMRAGEGRFTAVTERMSAAILDRMADHEQVLTGVRGLLMGSSDVTRDEWHAYVVQQELAERFPGMLGVGLAPRIAPPQRAAYETSVREHGLAGHGIFPSPGTGITAYPVQYIEPMTEQNAFVQRVRARVRSVLERRAPRGHGARLHDGPADDLRQARPAAGPRVCRRRRDPARARVSHVRARARAGARRWAAARRSLLRRARIRVQPLPDRRHARRGRPGRSAHRRSAHHRR
jgi:hypothetical protein